MPDELENIVRSMLRAIRHNIGELKTDMVGVKGRLGNIEAQSASLSQRVDRLSGNVHRILVRHELRDEHT